MSEWTHRYACLRSVLVCWAASLGWAAGPGGAPLARAAEPAGRSAATTEEPAFWAFRTPLRSPLPSVKQTGRVRTAIDTFLLARLEAKGLTFSAEADRTTLLRRSFLDLTGLPPTPEEGDAFLSDTTPEPYEHLLDRLLA